MNDLEMRLKSLLPQISSVGGEFELEPVAGGQSNPTFFITAGDSRLVLRMQPRNALPSAHAVDREYRILSALAQSELPVPEVLYFGADADVLGAPFYLMRRVEGRVFSDPTLPGVSASERKEIYFAMADTLATLHAVDWKVLGLADFGRVGGFFERQIARWMRQWDLSGEPHTPEIKAISQWLTANIPSDDRTSITHGDFRIGNLMFHPVEPRVVAVLDWELSTLGHPAADIAYSSLGWHLTRDEWMGFRDIDYAALGIPDAHEYLARYRERVPDSSEIIPFHMCFSLFRLAVIFQGIAARAKRGNAAAANAAEIGAKSQMLVDRAMAFI